MSTTILDHFDDIDDFEEVLEQAETHASTEREIEFVDSIRNKYDEYGERMFLSDAQWSWLDRLSWNMR